MKFGGLALLTALIAIGVPAVAKNTEPPPPWAFTIGGYATPANRAGANDDVPLHVPNSTMSFTRKQTDNIFNVADWHPDDHPPAPDIVMHGRPPYVYSCGACHYPNGLGGAPSAAIAGLPADYILEQLWAFKSGTRTALNTDMILYRGMHQISLAITDEEAKTAANYFASLKMTPRVKVIETNVVGKVRVGTYMLFVDPTKGTEPIGNRIIETTADPARLDIGDSQVGWVAYVPVGSIKKGKELAMNGANGKSQPCATCHGPDMRGTQLAPPIAGRGPSYMVRQLWNIQHGFRSGPETLPMQLVVENLTLKEIVPLIAYISSLDP
jgi:cytochrome c553